MHIVSKYRTKTNTIRKTEMTGWWKKWTQNFRW